jgi:hypothetical protein
LDKFGVLGLGFWVLQLGGGVREDGAGFVVVCEIYYGVARPVLWQEKGFDFFSRDLAVWVGCRKNPL